MANVFVGREDPLLFWRPLPSTLCEHSREVLRFGVSGTPPGTQRCTAPRAKNLID